MLTFPVIWKKHAELSTILNGCKFLCELQMKIKVIWKAYFEKEIKMSFLRTCPFYFAYLNLANKAKYIT